MEITYIYLDENGNSSDVQRDEFQYKIDQDVLASMFEEVNNHNQLETIKEVKYKSTGEPYIYEYDNHDYEQLLVNQLRLQREVECFSIINRGKLWYDSLTEGQLSELQTWYQAWLDVTDTKEIPELPSWLI